jgi:hypothetical protein
MQHSRDVPFRLLTRGHNQEMMPSSAAAVEFVSPRRVRVTAVALPEPGPDEVIVKHPLPRWTDTAAALFAALKELTASAR